MRRIGRIISRLLLGLVLLVVLVFCILQTPFAKRLVAEKVSSFLSATDRLGVEVDGITGFLPFEIGVERVEIADADGPWLEISRTHLQWSLLRFLRKNELLLDNLSIGKVIVSRRPTLGDAGGEGDRNTPVIPPVSLRRLKISEIDVDASVVGLAGSASVLGDLEISDSLEVTAALQVKHQIADFGECEAHVNAVYDGHAVDLIVETSLPEFPFIGRSDLLLAGNIEDGTYRFEADLDSDAFQLARVTIRGSSETIEATGAFDLTDEIPLTLDAGMRMDPAALDQGVEFTRAEGAYGNVPYRLTAPVQLTLAEDTVQVAPLHAEVMGFGLFLSGEVSRTELDIAANTRSISFDEIPGLESFDGWAEICGTLSGPLDSPELYLVSDAAGIRADESGLDALPEVIAGGVARIRGGELTVEAEALCEGLVTVAADGRWPAEFGVIPFKFSIPFRDPASGSLRANVTLDGINHLPLFADQQFHGRFVANLAYDGASDSIEVTGPFGFEEARYEHLGFGMRLTDITAAFDVDGSTLLLTDASASAGKDGSVSAAGSMSLSPNGDHSVKLDLELLNAPLLQLDELRTRFTGHVQLERNRTEGLRMDGDLKVTEGMLLLDQLGVAPTPALEVVEVGGDVAPAAKDPDGEEVRSSLPIAGDIEVQVPGPFVVRSGMIDSSWFGQLSLTRRELGWRVTGELHVRRGTLTFLGRPFRLNRGSLFLHGGVPVRPTLDVVAEHSRADLTAEIRMHGLLSNPRFELRSVPEFPQDEIISRILFGKSTSTITALQAAQLGMAVASMDGSRSGSSFTDRISDSLGVDTVEFREAGTEGAGGAAQLVAGKYFSEDLYVEFNQSLNTRGGSVRVQFEITPNFSVETETGSRMRPGIGLNWKMDY